MRRYKALIIGISYKSNTPNGWEVLDGPVQDAKEMETFVKDELRYGEVVVLTDETNSSEVSRRNILARFSWLVEGAKEGDILFLHYSGHGWQRPTRRRTEEDGLDETIVPADCPCPAKRPLTNEPIQECHIDCSCASNDPLCWKPAYRGMIRDNEMRDILVKPLVKGVRLVTLFDSCHSGSILDLRYHYLPRGAVPPILLSPRGFTTIRPEQRQSASHQRSHSGETLATSVGATLGHGMPDASLAHHVHATRSKVQLDATVSYMLGEALSMSAGMAFGHGNPIASPQTVAYHAHAVRKESQQDVPISYALTTALGTFTGIPFGHGIPTASIRMVDDHMHALRNESQRGVAISLSACIDPDVVFELKGSRGLLTTFFLKSMRKHKYEVPADVLIDKMYPHFHSAWKKKWSHILGHSPYPVLCSNQLIDLSSTFLI